MGTLLGPGHHSAAIAYLNTWSVPNPPPPDQLTLSLLMNTLIQKRHNHGENCITVKVSRRTQKLKIYVASEGRGLAFFSTDLGHTSRSNLGNEFGVMWGGKGPHKRDFAYDVVRIHFFMMYTDLIEYNIVGDTKAPLLRCFLFILKFKAGYIIPTGQYMNYQTFSNLQFRPLFKNSFHSSYNDLKDTSVEKIPFVSVGITRLVLIFRNASNIRF